MKALLCDHYGPAEELAIRELPDPEPGPGEVVIAVKAAALNFFDTLIIQGRYQTKPAFPFSPSAECAGTISAIGEGVTGWQVGERVAAWLGYGAAREKVAVPADQLIRIPDRLDDAQAAGLFVTYGTAMHGLIQRAGLKAGETLAVLGASGGAGLAAVEIGALLGAHVIACASSPDKLALAREHGAQEEIDYARDDIRAELKKLTEARGVDVLYDTVGGELAEPALRSMAWEGRYLVVGFAGGEIRKSRSTCSCSRAATCVACSGAISCGVTRPAIAATWSACWTGPRAAISAPMSMTRSRSSAGPKPMR